METSDLSFVDAVLSAQSSLTYSMSQLTKKPLVLLNLVPQFYMYRRIFALLTCIEEERIKEEEIALSLSDKREGYVRTTQEIVEGSQSPRRKSRSQNLRRKSRSQSLGERVGENHENHEDQTQKR